MTHIKGTESQRSDVVAIQHEDLGDSSEALVKLDVWGAGLMSDRGGWFADRREAGCERSQAGGCEVPERKSWRNPLTPLSLQLCPMNLEGAEHIQWPFTGAE